MLEQGGIDPREGISIRSAADIIINPATEDTLLTIATNTANSASQTITVRQGTVNIANIPHVIVDSTPASSVVGTITIGQGTVVVSSLPNITIGSAIPSGGNTIGSVTILGSLSTSPVANQTVTVVGSLPSGSNTLGSVTILGSLTTTFANNQTVNIVAGSNTIGSVSVVGTIPVSGTFWQTPQPISGTITVSQGTVVISALPTVTINAIPAGGNTIGSVTILGTLSTTFPANQTVTISAGTVSVNALPTGSNTIGTVTIGALSAGSNAIGTVGIVGALPSGGNTIGTVTMIGALAAGSNAIGTVSISQPLPSGNNVIGTVTITGIGYSAGKTNVFKTGRLVSTAVTTQTIVSYQVTTGKTFYILGTDANARLTTLTANSTVTIYGSVSIESPIGTKIYESDIASVGMSNWQPGFVVPEPIPIASAQTIRIMTTPFSASSMQWTGNIYGYEK